MFEYIYENAKKALFNQKDMQGIASVYKNKDYTLYFHRYTDKYFTHHSKKNDNRMNYNEFYREIKNKSMIDTLCSCFDTVYNTCLNDIEYDKLHNWQIEDLEIIIAKYEITVGKIITMQSPLAKENKCSKDEVIEYMKTRDLMVEKSDSFKDKTIEYRRMMSD